MSEGTDDGNTGQVPEYRARLRRVLTVYFDESEMRSLCFDLGIDYELLGGADKQTKAVELITFCERRGRLLEVLAACHRLRPNATEVSSLPDYLMKHSGRLDIKLGRANRETGVLLATMASTRMAESHYDAPTLKAFRRVFEELLENGLEYGADVGQEIDISVDVNNPFTTLTVINANGQRFDLARILQAKQEQIRQNPWLPKGRGLLLANELADTLESTADFQGIRACFYGDTVVFSIELLERLLIIEIAGGLYNPSINRRLYNTIYGYSEFDALIIHVPGDTSTKVMGAWLDLYAILKSRGQRMSVFLGEGWSGWFNVRLLPRELVSYSWEQALLAVWKGRLRTRVDELCHMGRLKAY